MRDPIEQSGPDLAVSSMVPRPIDLGIIPELAEDTSDMLVRNPWLRYLALAVLAGLVLWGLYSVTQ